MTGAVAEATGAAGEAPIAAVETAQSDTATAAAVRLRVKPDMTVFPMDVARFSSSPL
jgi:hypothetical protein